MRRIVPIFIILMSIAGCTTTRIHQFDEFAEAGKAYADAVEAVTEEAGNAAVDADSTLLARLRENFEYQDRVDTITEHNKLLKQRLRLLRNIRRHGRILKRYFMALSNIIQSKSPEEMVTMTEELVETLGTMSDDIKEAKIGNMTVSEFTGPAATIVVAQVRVQVLEAELKKHAKMLERALDLQEAALKMIVSQLKTDLQAILLNLETAEIVKPYIADKKLPSNWARKRKEILTATITLDAAHAAARAAKDLKTAFIALVENKFEFAHIDAIITDIEEIYILIDTIITDEETAEED